MDRARFASRFLTSLALPLGPTIGFVLLAAIAQAQGPALVPQAPPGDEIVEPSVQGTLPAPQPAEPQVIAVRFEGTDPKGDDKLRSLVQTRAGRPLNTKLIEDDVRRLNATRLFLDVRPLYQQVPGGVIVVFRVVERPILRYVEYVGNEKLRDKQLRERTGLKVGDPIDPYAIEEGRRKIEVLYGEKGYANVRVEIFEGNKKGDRGAVYVIHEGPRQRIRKVDFVGNTITSDARLKTQIQSKPPILGLLKGYVERDKIDQDVDRLTAYYRSLGYFRARIGRELKYDEKNKWVRLTFYVDEGPRYKIRSLSFIGNQKFQSEDLREQLELQPGQFFNQALMNEDVGFIRDLYGSEGYVFADIQADPRFLEEPGELDLVYSVDEGARYRVGRINVHIEGENPHTKRTTVLNRLSFQPGEIVDIRELRDSERRLQASGLFLHQPQQGITPKIVFSPPEFDEESVAEKPQQSPNRGFRGQSPDPDPRPRQPLHRPTDSQDQRNRRTPAAASPEEPMVVRGQYDPFGGGATASPSVGPVQPRQRYTAPTTRAPTSQYPPTPQYASPYGQQPTVVAPPPINYGAAPPSAGVAQPGNVPPAGQPTTSGVPNVVAGPQPGFAPSAPGASPAPFVSQPPPGTVVAPFVPPSGPQPSGQGVLPAPNPANVDDIYPDDGVNFLEPPPRDLDVDVLLQETQTGRLMFGVGVNSSVGLLGNIVIDEQNFDLFRFPRSFDDLLSGTAFRGAGQRFRVEAVPGSEVQRYLVSLTEPYLFDTPISLGLSGFFFDRRYREWDEQRLGGRVSLGRRLTPDLTATVALSAQNVNVRNPIVPTPDDLTAVLGDNDIYIGRFGLTHDTRDSTFLPTEGHYIELAYEQGFGEFDFPRGTVDARQYFLIRQRDDRSGRHVLALRGRLGITGNQTPIFERFFAGGFSTLRGFDFRGVSPRVFGVPVGGEFQMLGSAEYLFPITADDMLRGVFFVDVGTVEESVKLVEEDFRVAPGFGLRITVPALGPAPIALDFAVPVARADGDEIENFSFFVGLTR